MGLSVWAWRLGVRMFGIAMHGVRICLCFWIWGLRALGLGFRVSVSGRVKLLRLQALGSKAKQGTSGYSATRC